MLMEPAKDPPPGLNIANPDTLYIRQSKWQKRRGEGSRHLFQMGTVTPNGRCDAIEKGLTQRHLPHPMCVDAVPL